MKDLLKNKTLPIVLIACFVIAGVLVGYSTLKNTSLAPQPLTSKQPDADYIAAVPSVGPLLDRRKITLTSIDADNLTAKLELPTKELGEIKNAQRVLFFKKNFKAQHYTGTIENIKISGANATISISIPDKIDIETLALTADIFTLERRKVKRIPLTALIKDDDGKFFVWVVRTSPKKEPTERRTALDTTQPIISGAARMKNKKPLNLHQDLIGKVIKHSVEKLYVRPGNHNNLLLDVGYNFNRRTIIVMNPDEKLVEGQEYSFLFKTIKAPSLLPHYEAALIEGRKIERKLLAELRQKATNCQNERKQLIEENNLSPDYFSNKKDLLGKQSVNYSEKSDINSAPDIEWDVLSLLGLSEEGAPTGSCGF